MTHTWRPSVTGEGDDMFCFCAMWFESARRRFHATERVVRSTAQSSSAPVLAPVATLRKIVLPQTMGVDPL
jgi:hypothetical protein